MEIKLHENYFIGTITLEELLKLIFDYKLNSLSEKDNIIINKFKNCSSTDSNYISFLNKFINKKDNFSNIQLIKSKNSNFFIKIGLIYDSVNKLFEMGVKHSENKNINIEDICSSLHKIDFLKIDKENPIPQGYADTLHWLSKKIDLKVKDCKEELAFINYLYKKITNIDPMIELGLESLFNLSKVMEGALINESR